MYEQMASMSMVLVPRLTYHNGSAGAFHSLPEDINDMLKVRDDMRRLIKLLP